MKVIGVGMIAKDGVIAKIPVHAFLVFGTILVRVDVLIELGRRDIFGIGSYHPAVHGIHGLSAIRISKP